MFAVYAAYLSFISEHLSIILTVLVLGIITQTTKIYSLASFFFYLIASLLFDFLR
jgi:hypothetical protein